MTIDEAVRNLDNLLIACDQSGREAWQTLKTAVLAQQTNNKQSTPCHWCDGVHPMLNHAIVQIVAVSYSTAYIC